MTWAAPQFPKSSIDWAGRVLVGTQTSGRDIENALNIINNWRSSHSFPLNTFQVGLREKAWLVDRSALIAQRIKRLSSIRAKLIRFPTMKLSQMQDIGGCRAVVSDCKRVFALRRS